MTTTGFGDSLYDINIRVLGNDAPGGGVNVDNIGPGAGGSHKTNKKEDQEKSNTGNLEEMKKSAKGYLRSTLGIQVGVAALLKQSQIFTGVLGTIFQILGAMVDVVLAAFMPLIIPALRTMANSIPQIQQKAQEIKEWIERAVEWLRTLGARIQGQWWYKYVKQAVTESLQYVIIGFLIFKIVPFWGTLITLTKFFGGLGIKWLAGIYNNTLMNRIPNRVGADLNPGGDVFMQGPLSRRDMLRNKMGMYSSRGGFGAGLVGGALVTGGMTAWGAAQGGSEGAMRAAKYSGIGGAVGMVGGMAFGPGGMMLGSIIGSTAGGLIANMLGDKMDEAREKQRQVNADNGARTKHLFSGMADNPKGGFDDSALGVGL